MNSFTIASGTIHKVPADLKNVIFSKPKIYAVWQDITPLSRNEWICWIESAVKSQTRERRIKVMVSKMLSGERRPCCWAGCIHR